MEWPEIVKTLHYQSEAEMWNDLYNNKKWGINKLSTFLGFGVATIRRRLIKSEIKMRPKGGPQPRGGAKLKLLRMDPRIAVYGSLIETARIANLDKTTVYHWRRWLCG